MKVTIYTIPDCPYSKEEKDYLTAKGVQYDEKDVSDNKDNLSEMLDLSNKFAGVPFSVVTKDSGEKVMLKGFTKADFDLVLDGGSEAQGQAEAPAESGAQAPVAPVAGVGMTEPTAPVMPAVGMPSAPVMPSVPSAMPTDTLATSMPSAPAMPSMPDMPNLTIPTAPTSGVMPAPVMPTVPVMPTAPSIPSAPAMPSIPDMPTMSGMPTTSGMSTPSGMPASTGMPAPQAPTTEPADPQAELSGLLKDLEAKVATDAQAGAPAQPASPTTPQL